MHVHTNFRWSSWCYLILSLLHDHAIFAVACPFGSQNVSKSSFRLGLGLYNGTKNNTYSYLQPNSYLVKRNFCSKANSWMIHWKSFAILNTYVYCSYIIIIIIIIFIIIIIILQCYIICLLCLVSVDQTMLCIYTIKC